MNLILLEETDFTDTNRVQLRGRRQLHVRKVHRASPGDLLRVGLIGGQLGTGEVIRLDPGSLELAVTLDTPPPPPSEITLVIALPRPPSLRKVLQSATAMGVKHFVLLHTRRVEKSYWQSSGLAPEALRRQLLLGLEQARDTIVPRVELSRRFRPFVEDELPALLRDSRGIVAHPNTQQSCPRSLEGKVTLIVGPEGGFLPEEIQRLEVHRATCVALGARILRVETAVVALLARITP